MDNNLFDYSYDEGYDEGYENGYEECYDEGFCDEEDAHVNSNDPFRKGKDKEKSYELFDGFPNLPDTITIAGAMVQTENGCDDDADYDNTFDEKLDGDIFECITMEQHMKNAAKAKDGIPGVKKHPLRPFEQWLEDVKVGKKTINDSL